MKISHYGMEFTMNILNKKIGSKVWKEKY
jgi:hypothetical protein